MKNILLIGTGRFGRHIAVQLSQLGHQVMAVDTNEERISDVLPYVTNAQIGDSTNAEFLRSLGIGNFDVCIVTILKLVFALSSMDAGAASVKAWKIRRCAWQKMPPS